MQKAKLGCAPYSVGRIGLGCMGMSEFYGPSDDELSAKVILEAVANGVDFLDTSDMYGQGHNEELLACTLAGVSDSVRIATKFGIVRQPGGGYSRGLNNSPGYIRKACEDSLRRLKRDVIDLYYIHRLDPKIPIEESVGELGRLVEQGKIRAIGLCEVSADTLKRAHAAHPIAALQSEYSLWTRDAERSVLATCRALDIAFVAYSPLGRGMLTGRISDAEDLGKEDFRPSLPRFQGQNFNHNMTLVRTLEDIANDLSKTPAQISLAWLLAQGPDVFPIPGTRRPTYLRENLGALDIQLTKEVLMRIDRALPFGAAAGDRYSEEGMKGVQM